MHPEHPAFVLSPAATQAFATAELKVARGRCLFHQDDEFKGFYCVKSGLFKSISTTPGGREHVTGFKSPGDVVGLDGAATGRYTTSAIALEDSRVQLVDSGELLQASGQDARHNELSTLMSREIVRDQSILLMLGSLSAQERLAGFLLDLLERSEARGVRGGRLHLTMTRHDIGSHLGLTLETVSRSFSKLAAHGQGPIRVRWRDVFVLDPHSLAICAGHDWARIHRRTSGQAGCAADALAVV